MSAREETKMSFSECVPSPNIADETTDGPHKIDFVDSPSIVESELFKRPAIKTDLPIPVPFSESQPPKRPTIEPVHTWANQSIPIGAAKLGPVDATDKVASAIAATSHIDTDTAVAMVDSARPSKSLNKKFRFSPKGILVAMVLGQVIGLAIGAAWSSPSAFTENLKATDLRGLVEGVFAGSSKPDQSAQLLSAAADARGPKLNEIVDQLVAIGSDLSAVKQDIKEIAAGQEQIRQAQEQLAETQSAGQERIRKAQEQLAQAQSRFAASQLQAHLKQNPQPSPPPPDGRKLNRRDVYYYPSR